MDPVTMMAIGSVAAPVIGGLMGNMAASKDKAAQKAAMQRAIAELNKLGSPPDVSKALVLQEFQRAGIYTPELEQDLSDSFAESQMGKLTEDTGLREAQKSALASLQDRAKVGLSAEDRASLNQVRAEVQRDANANRQALLQKFAAMGQGGGGQSFAAQLQASQAAADQGSAASDTLMAQAQQRALQALTESSNLAGNIRSQDFGVSSAKASALDERNRFLAENSIGRQQRNVAGLNQAQQLNLSEQQRIADANVAMQNAEKARQADAARQYFQDKQSLAQAKANAQVGQATQLGQQAANTAASYTGMGSAVGTGLGAFGQREHETNIAKIAASKGK